MTSSTPATLAPSTNGVDHASDTGEALRQVIDKISRNSSADTAFGTPRVVGERTLIPVARVMYGFGGGSGGERDQQRGGGAGGGVAVRPIAVIEATSEKVRVVPVVDVQSMMSRVFAFAALAMLVGTLMRRPWTRRPGWNVKIGRISPRLSVTSTPTFKFRAPPSRFIMRRLFRGH